MKVKRFGGTNKVGHRKVTENLGRFEIHILKDDSFNLAMQVIPQTIQLHAVPSLLCVPGMNGTALGKHSL